MFSTFRANTDPTTTTTTTNVSKSSARPRRRQQVSRACDWCRVNRIKCDDEQPCKNCQSRGEHCSNSRLLEATSLPSANRDILRLRSKVKDLQEQLRLARQEAAEARVRQAQIQTPAQTNSSNPSLHPSPDAIIDSIRVTEQSSDPAISKEWQGLRELGARTGNLYYGPMSSSYFLARITQYLSSDALNQSFGDVSLKKCLADINYKSTPQQQQQSLSDTPYYAEDLTRVQEEYYLVLLWQAFHCVYPILSETEFNQYYDSLWLSIATPDGTATRKPSALVDVLLAVCMQFGSVFLFGEHHGTQETQHAPQPQKNVHMAGHIHYQRAQRLLQNELEQPSIMTLQTHIYMIIYLYNISQFNAAHSNLGTTLRIAQALRLHLRPAEGTSLDDQALYRRIWSTIYRLDAQLSMNLGRPALVQNSELDHDQPEQTRISGTSLLSSFEDISYLSFHIQCTKLISAVQGAQAAFETKCSQLLIDANSVNGDIHDDPIITEALAEFFNRKTTLVREWVQSVPKSLKCARKGEGEAFSTDRSSLNLDTYIPLWLQRQRLLLELLYHHLQISLLRQFIRFPPVAQSLTPLADGLSISCVYHAITITNILHQVLSETDLAHGWFHVYQYQWDAVLCTLGFVLANPVCPPTPPARKSLKAAVRNLEIIGEHFAAAASAARLVHDVNGRMDRVTQQFRRNLMGWRRSSAAGQKDSTSLTPSPLDEVVLQTSTGSYLSETAATTSSLGLGPGVWSDQPVPAIEIGPTPLVTTTDTPTMSMALDDMQWMQGTIDSWTDFTV